MVQSEEWTLWELDDHFSNKMSIWSKSHNFTRQVNIVEQLVDFGFTEKQSETDWIIQMRRIYRKQTRRLYPHMQKHKPAGASAALA